jgi:YVTN family beta-propeller protein
VAVVDTATGTVTTVIATATSATRIVLNAVGTVAYVSSQSGNGVIVIDTTTMTVTATIPTGAFPEDVGLSAGGSLLYVANQNANTMSVIDTATDTVSGNIATGNGPIGLALIFVPAPVVSAVSPGSGPLTAGTAVTITGTGLAGATAVRFGAGNPAAIVSSTATSCTVVAPAGVVGTVDVQVTTAGGTSGTSSADQYTYVAAPVVTAISPAAGPAAGGTTVTITGTGLARATAVTFGAGNPAAAISSTATSCTAVAPAKTAGLVDVQVTTAGGTSATSSADQYAYVAPFPFAGFLPPVGSPPAVNHVHAGQAIPIRFSLCGNHGLNVIAPGYPLAQQVDCATGAPIGAGTETETAGHSGLHYDAGSDTYAYVWKTSKASAGTCLTFILGLTDDTFHTASFQYAGSDDDEGDTGRHDDEEDRAGVVDRGGGDERDGRPGAGPG